MGISTLRHRWNGPDAMEGYVGLPRGRRRVLAAAILLHGAIGAVLLMARQGEDLHVRSGGAVGAEIKTFQLASADSAPRFARMHGAQDGQASQQVLLLKQADGPAPEGLLDATDAVRQDGDTGKLASLVREVLADDAGGGDPLSYRDQLLEHIRPFRAYPREALRTGLSGQVVVRFRIGRAGEVVDLRILASRGAVLDEAAMRTIWRAEPLPPVPATLPTPWEVDLPIDFFPPNRVRS